MIRPAHAQLSDGRLHFQHGPIDLILSLDGLPSEIEKAKHQGWVHFVDILSDLMKEIDLLRSPVGSVPQLPRGCVAARMVSAVKPHSSVFVTPMAAVAGAVADSVLSALLEENCLRKAYVNNGGDIAFHLEPGENYRTGVVSNIDNVQIDAFSMLSANMKARGLATSGWRGRSYSFGIADSVTVLANNAAAADVAATLIGNAVDVDDPAIDRCSAKALDPDSDLGENMVTVGVGELSERQILVALRNGCEVAEEMRGAGLIIGAYLKLGTCNCSVGRIEGLALDLN